MKKNFLLVLTITLVAFTSRAQGISKQKASDGDYFEDFRKCIPGLSDCFTPSNPSVVNITATSAKLRWDAVPNTRIYCIRYKIAGTNDWTTLYSTACHKMITGLLPTTEYRWQVKTLCQADSSDLSSPSAKRHFVTGPSPLTTTTSFRLSSNYEQPTFQVYPNPASDHATIQFTLSQPSQVRVIIYDLSGREVEILMSGQLPAGRHTLQLNTSKFSKGLYVVKMITNFGIQNEKLIVQ